MRLSNRIAVVTGAGRGLGRAIALRFAEEGADVAAADLLAANVEETAAMVRERGRRALAVTVDISQPEQSAALMERVAAELGGLDILVNAAGVVHNTPFLEMTPAEWDRVFNVNARGTFFALQAAARVMVRLGKGGKIINITSPASLQPTPLQVAYGASKAAVDSITRSAALALAPYHITVNCIAPGRMPTQMITQIEEELARILKRDIEELRRERTAQHILGRMGTPEEVAGAAVFIASSEGDYMTASRLNISGGLEVS